MPSLDNLTELVAEFSRDNMGLVVAIMFVLGFAESIVFVSFFVPSTVLFLAIGGVYGAAGGAFLHIWLAGAAGAALGDLLSYLAGRLIRNDMHRIWPFTRQPGLIPKGRALFERWGFWSILLGKFIGGLRPLIPIVAGALDMPWALFVLGSVLSSVMWAGLFLAPGYGISWLSQ